MDDLQDPPKVFANRVIRQMVDHSFGEDFALEPKDYRVIRVAFASLGGSWLALSKGSLQNLSLLKQVITQWGQEPSNLHKDKEFV